MNEFNKTEGALVFELSKRRGSVVRLKGLSQGLPFEAIDRSLSLIDHLNTRQAIEFSIAY